MGAFYELPPTPNKRKVSGSGAGKESTATTSGQKSRSSSVSSVSSNSSKKDKNKNQEKGGLFQMLQHEKEHHHQHQQQDASPQPLQQQTRLRKRDRVRALFSSSSSSSTSPPNTHSSHPPHPASLHSASSSSPTFSLSTVLMASEHDIYLKWPHPVPKEVQVYIAGTFKVPGHVPWEKLPMSYSELNQCWEVHLDVQEVEHHQHLPEDDLPANTSAEDDHSIHSNHSTLSTLSKEDSSASSKTTTPKGSRSSRFFGRAKTGDKKETPASAAAAPHRHEPLRKTYHYLYKFIVGDDWQCDWDKPQVQDQDGHWNHELTVELVEQAPALAPAPASAPASASASAPPTPLPSTTESTRTKPHGHSRTSSIHSIQSVQLATVDEDKTLTEEPFAAIQEEEHRPPQPPANTTQDVSDGSTATAPSTAAPRPKSRRSVRMKDTYEAVMIFDERDDLSDGEGRSRVITDDDGLSDEDEPMPQQEPTHGSELQHAAEGDKQHQHHPQTAEDDAAAADNAVAPSFTTDDAALTVPAADNEPQPKPLGVQDEENEAQANELAQHNEPHPQDEAQDELHTSAPRTAAPVANDTSSSSTSYAAADAIDTSPSLVSQDRTEDDDKNKELNASLPTAVEGQTEDHAALHTAEEEQQQHQEEEEKTDLAAAVAAAVATPPVSRPTPPIRRRSYAEIVATQPMKPFRLQEAVDPEARSVSAIPTRSSTAPPPSTTSEPSAETSKDHITTTTPRGYYSPPLTPPTVIHTLEDSPPPMELSSDEEEREQEKKEQVEGKKQYEGSQNAPATPQSVKHSSPKVTQLTHSKETSGASQFSQSSQHEEEEEEEAEEEEKEKEQEVHQQSPPQQENDKDARHEVLDPRGGFDDKAPVRLPSLLWSLTKTTVVVSATVVLLGFGFGRRRE
ncbi:hypothetical protein BGZ73_006241 [Actinomortierella ambigua]|nr:hypothetical protein BGZ73_006241 [Actinomortierella ambigua]